MKLKPQIPHLIGAGRVTDCSRAGDGFPPRIVVRGRLCAGMTEAVDLGSLVAEELFQTFVSVLSGKGRGLISEGHPFGDWISSGQLVRQSGYA